MDEARQLLQETQQLRGEFLDQARNILKRFETVNLSELPQSKVHDVIESIKYLRLICTMEAPENSAASNADSEFALLKRSTKN